DHKMLLHFLQLSDQTQIFVDTSIYQNAGADIVQQLAYALGHVTEYLEFLDKSNIKQKEISMHVAIAGNYFFEIAKLKALRYLWEQLTLVFTQQPALFISATPSRRNKTLYDYNVNMLRTTTECMSAVLGGANMVYNKAYDSIYHKDNEFGDRIARNQLLILKNEAYFDKVSNPTEGAYYIESLTDQFADKALSLLKEIEASGGFLQQLKKGKIQEKIQEKHLAAAQQVANQEHILVGTNR
ncbi:MAG: methylmalonyl-CoA mutase family protein, partial [Flavobacteriaceae bacterium]|nr:methylmalonyl-CoA mutase family protein [Flavobacteriaceae bacterium]